MSDSDDATRLPQAKWISKMLSPAKLRRWDDVRHKAYEQILAAQATANPYLLDTVSVPIYLRRITQGLD